MISGFVEKQDEAPSYVGDNPCTPTSLYRFIRLVLYIY